MEENIQDEESFNESETPNENDSADKSISSDLIRGHINTIILRSLYDGDKYGYEIIAEIERKSHGQYSLKQPSLYSALKRLEREGYVTSYWGGSVAGGRRKYFSLTDAGKEISERNQSEWEYSRTVIDSLISDKDFDFDNPAPTAVDMRVLKRSTSRVPSRESNGEETDDEYEFSEKSPAIENEELAQRRAAFEEERARLEEDIRLREEALKMSEEERARRDEELRLREEQLKAEEEERNRILTENSEKARAEEERRAQEEEERAKNEAERIEQLLKAQEEELRTRHERELAEQEQRIREEDEQYFRQRTQQIIHQNYINLVNTPPEPETKEAETAYYPPASETAKEPASPETYPEQDRGYRSVISKLYANTLQEEPPKAPEPVAASVVQEPPAPVQKAEPEPQKPEPKLLGRMDFDDLETRAARDGIRITTSGEGRPKETEISSDSLVHKGKALFFSSIVVFLFFIAVGSVSLGFQKSLGLPAFYPYFIWCTGLALLLVMGLAYVNHYGEHSLRYTGNILINTIVSYALCVILILIVALAAQINFSEIGQLVTFIILPVVYFFGIIIFGLVYYLQIRPKKEN